MSEHRVAGGARVSRRALVDIIRPAVAGSYGVTGFVARNSGERLLGWLRLADPGIRVSTRGGLAIDLDLTVAFGLPVAEVARQADSAVRYALRRALGRDVERLTIHVGGMRYAGDQAAASRAAAAPSSSAPSASAATVSAPATLSTEAAAPGPAAASTEGRPSNGHAPDPGATSDLLATLGVLTEEAE